MATCSVIIEAEKSTQHCGQQVNAIIAVFHAHGVNLFYMAFSKCQVAGVSYVFGQSA